MHFSLFISRHFDFTLRQNEKLQHQALECCKTYKNTFSTLNNTNNTLVKATLCVAASLGSFLMPTVATRNTI